MNESEAEHGPIADGEPAASPVAGVAIWGSEAWRAEALAWLAPVAPKIAPSSSA